MSNTLFDDIFNITEVDSARYNKVSRIVGSSTTSSDIKITLDINSDLFPVKTNDSLTVTLASSLSLEEDSNPHTATTSWRPPKAGEKSLADDYDYVMYGTVYKFEESSDDKM
jgi:DNA-directed RNA polymerase I, II, and III subunit RPABC3